MLEIPQVCFRFRTRPKNKIQFSFFLTVLQQGDVLKVDFGVHVNGRIVDSAFTLTFDHTYDKLVEAVQAATETGVRVCNPFPSRIFPADAGDVGSGY